MEKKSALIPQPAFNSLLRRLGLLLSMVLLLVESSRTFAAVTLGNGATMDVLGTGNLALLGQPGQPGGPITDPEDDGDEAAGEFSPTWNWRAISSSAEPGFGGGEFSYNVFDHLVDGGGTAKWCCGEPITFGTLSAAIPLNITVQLNDRYRLTHFTITSGNDTPARDPRDWQILGSSDGITFEPIFTQIGTGAGATTTTNGTTGLWGTVRLQVNKFTLDAPARPYSYLRFECTATYSTPPFATAAAFFQISEIEYYGLQGGALTIEPVGIGTAALLKSDLTDPENNGNKAAGPTDPSWNWTSITANNKPSFGVNGAFNVFDNSVDGSTNKWCCDDATAASPLNVTVEFPRGLALTHFTITSADDAPDGDPTKFQILGSNDGTTFTPIYTRDSATSLWTARNQVIRITLQDPSPLYKYLRYEATETPGSIHQLGEIEYFGKYGGVSNPAVSDIVQAASFAAVRVTDGLDTILDGSTVQLMIDNQVVAVTTNKVGTVTTINHNRTPFFASGSAHTWSFSAKDNAGNPLARSGNFTTPTYTPVRAEYALASVDTSKPGFRTKVNQIDVNKNPSTGLPANAERQLADGYIDPSTGLPYANGADLTTAVGGFIEVPGVVNWNSTIAGNSGAFTNDEAVPGISPPTYAATATDRYVVSIETILELKAGVNRFAVNSDDGFRFSFGWGPGDVAGTQFGTAGDRGFTESLMDVVVPVDGFYPVRVMYWETGGGDGCEFYTVDLVTSKRTLVNDLNSTDAVKAYRESLVSRPYVSRTLPSVNYGYAFADQDVIIDLTDGAIPLSGTPTLRINNVDQTITTGKTNNVTTIRRASSISSLLFSGANNVTLIYSYASGGNTLNVTNTWAFTVPAYTWPIPAANKVLASEVSGSGFKERAARQIDRSGDTSQGNGGRHTGSNMPGPEIELADGYINPTNNLPFANLIDTSTANPDGSYDIAEVLNFNHAQSVGGPAANAGIFNQDLQIPGLPGTGSSNFGLDNSVHEFITYLELKAGAHIFGMNVDDGWMVTSAPNPRDTLGTLLGFRNAPGGQNNSPLNNPNAAFNVIVPEDGIYPFRILFWEGGGGVNLEFLEVDRQTGTQILVNDVSGFYPSVVATSGQLISSTTARNTYTGPARPWVKFSVYPIPYIGVTNPRVNGGAAVTLWQNRNPQVGPGPILVKQPALQVTATATNWNSGEIQAATGQRPFGDSVGAVVADLGTGAVGMVLDGVSVTPSVTDVPNSTDKLVLYTPNPPLSSSSNHVAGLLYAGTTNFWIFNVIAVTNVSAADMLASGMADASAIGFHARVFQATNGQPNTAARAELQIAGLTNNVAIAGTNADGSYTIPGFINWNVQKNPGNTTGEIGNFQPTMTGTPDDPVPGIPGTGLAGTLRFENIAAELFAYLDLPAGYQKFGVNGDDGWKVQVGIPGQTNGTVLFTADRGGGSQDIPFAFITPQAGLLPVRLVWYQGGGGGNLEFFTYGANGSKNAVNDRNNPNSVKAYYNVITTPQLRFTTATLTGGTLTIDWSGTGRLQQAATLTGHNSDWSDVANPPKPYTVQVGTTGQNFYRLISP